MIEYKVLKEYDRYYLCEHPKGYKVCLCRKARAAIR